MSNNRVLICNTTRQEREKIVNGALAISTLDCKEPTPEDMIFFEKYINGEMEVEEIIKTVIEKYTSDSTISGTADTI
ncbi:MAG: hypothetical protein Q4F05_19760 [bacterium]|nr:hypothetical protein [bacterium]